MYILNISPLLNCTLDRNEPFPFTLALMKKKIFHKDSKILKRTIMLLIFILICMKQSTNPLVACKNGNIQNIEPGNGKKQKPQRTKAYLCRVPELYHRKLPFLHKTDLTEEIKVTKKKIT